MFGTLPHFSHILAKWAYRIFFRIFWHFRRQWILFVVIWYTDNQYSLLSEHGGRWCRRFVAASWIGMSEKQWSFLPIRPIHVLSRLWYAVNLLNNDCAIPSPQKCTHVRFMRICNRGLFPHIFAAYFAITWSAYFEKNVRFFLTCLTEVWHLLYYVLYGHSISVGIRLMTCSSQHHLLYIVRCRTEL